MPNDEIPPELIQTLWAIAKLLASSRIHFEEHSLTAAHGRRIPPSHGITGSHGMQMNLSKEEWEIIESTLPLLTKARAAYRAGLRTAAEIAAVACAQRGIPRQDRNAIVEAIESALKDVPPG